MDEKSQDIEKMMQCFDQLEQVPLKPFFYTRLKAKMDLKESKRKFEVRMGIAMLVSIIVINLAVLLSVRQTERKDNNAQLEINLLSNDYYTYSSGIYSKIEAYETK